MKKGSVHPRTLAYPKCPRCQSRTRKNGHPPGANHQSYQNYICTHPACRHQFVPDVPPRPRQHPTLRCPLCGRAMDVYKKRSFYWRFRCTGRRHQSHPCRHKLNVPSPSFTPLSDPFQAAPTLSLRKPFHLSRLRCSPRTLSLALYFAILLRLPSVTVSQILSDLFDVSVSADTIDCWVKKAAVCLHHSLGTIRFPLASVWHADETFLFHNRHKVFWAIRDRVHKLIVAWFYSTSRAGVNAMPLLHSATCHGLSQPAAFVSDGFSGYALAAQTYLPQVPHQVWKGFSHLPNNCVIERQHGWLKDPLPRFRGLNALASLAARCAASIYCYNFFLPREDLGGKTPAESAGVTIRRWDSPWQTMMHYIFAACA